MSTGLCVCVCAAGLFGEDLLQRGYRPDRAVLVHGAAHAGAATRHRDRAIGVPEGVVVRNLGGVTGSSGQASCGARAQHRPRSPVSQTGDRGDHYFHAYKIAASSICRTRSCGRRTRRIPQRQGCRRVSRPLPAHALRLAPPAAGTAELPHGSTRPRHVQAGSTRRLGLGARAGRFAVQCGPQPAELSSAASR